MSGEKEFQKQTAGEREAFEMGQQQLETGRGIERGNLQRLRRDSLYDASDRANMQADVKAQAAEGGTVAREAGIQGLRRAGPSGAGYLAMNEADDAAANAMGTSQVAARDAMENQDLQTKAGLMEQGLTGQSEAQKGFEAGVSGLGQAAIAKTINRNLKSEQDADTFTNLGMLGLKGLGMAATHFGTKVGADGKLEANTGNPIAAWAAQHGFFNQATAEKKMNDRMFDDGGNYTGQRSSRRGFLGFGTNPLDRMNNQYSATRDDLRSAWAVIDRYRDK